MFQAFDDVDEMFASIRRGVEDAKSRATDKQNSITYGDYWMRNWNNDLLIFGHITPYDDLVADSRRLCADEDEFQWEMESMKGNYDNGFRFGRAYSVACPEGELGDTHVSTMIPISEEAFEEAKSLNWSPMEIAKCDWFQDILKDILYGNIP